MTSGWCMYFYCVSGEPIALQCEAAAVSRNDFSMRLPTLLCKMSLKELLDGE